ncbi:unnamed protein product [Rotaria sordida]|uniref:Uncharacterized protein n=1 Tax=Rotaria sordida TaxID=392033 RepID=A0A819Z5V1_9BILA|nr:unnamed protein product [Rotaria sordida]
MAMTTSNLNSTKTIARRSMVSEAKIVNEQVLSQELDQFSPFKINSMKKQITRFPIEIILSETIGSEWQSIPDYLCSKNPSFEKKLRTILPSTTNLDELRDIAILMHKIMSIDIVQSLWIVYRKYGMEEIQSKRPINVSDTEFWPKRRLQSLRIEINEHIATVQYHYTDIIFQQTFFAQNLNTNQIQLMKRICKLKYNQEMTKCEVKLMKEKIASHLISHRFEHESIIKLSRINSIRESRTREELYKQFKNVAEQTRSNMMIAYMECAEGQKQQYQKQYDVAMKELHDIQEMHPSNQQLTEVMWNLIQQRLTNITSHIESIYKFKTQLFRLKSTIH